MAEKKKPALPGLTKQILGEISPLHVAMTEDMKLPDDHELFVEIGFKADPGIRFFIAEQGMDPADDHERIFFGPLVIDGKFDRMGFATLSELAEGDDEGPGKAHVVKDYTRVTFGELQKDLSK